MNPQSTRGRTVLPMDQIVQRIDKTIKSSPADETEIVWIERLSSRVVGRDRQLQEDDLNDRTILIRVVDRKRVGSHRTSTSNPAELDGAVRAAIAQSRSRQPLPGLLHFSADDSPLKCERRRLWDPQIAELDHRQVAAMFEPWLAHRGTTCLEWTQARVAVINSRGVRRQAEVTSAAVETRTSRSPGAGRAAAASRFLDHLRPGNVVDRSRKLRVSGDVAELPAAPVALVLSPEATCKLIDILNRVAFSAVSYYSGSSFLREHLDVQVFDRAINLRDDGCDPKGMPFPFDLEGSPKHPTHLILKGSPKTPALDQRQAAQLGLSPTAHAIGGNDARAMNLYLEPGEESDTELIRSVGDGVWIGWFDGVECFEPSRVQIRALARSVRRIENGTLTAAMPDLIWEDSLLRAFSNLLGIGSLAVQQISSDRVLGGISTPAIAFTGISQLRIAT